MNRFSYFFFILVLFACNPNAEEKCVLAPETKIELKFSALEDSIPSVHTKQELVDFFSHHIALRDVFFGRRNFPSDSVFINHYFKKFTNPALDTVLMDVKKVFNDGASLKDEFRVAFSNMKYYYPEFRIPRVETVITGLESDLFVSDSLVIVGLDFFLGKNGRYKPDMHDYILRRYEKNFIVPSTLLLYGIDGKYNSVNLSDRTVLAEMIAYGKAYHFAKRMLPCSPDSIFIGYTSKEIEGAKANQDMIWKRLVDDEALFSTSQQMKQRYIGERPKTYEVGNECPGRIATWVGWQMVNEYAKQNASISLPELMKITDAQKIFKGSKYSVKLNQ
ncbi:MAG TPA: gliding motility lipoprotein GldB [Cyclobacteriaceae bacterium]|jgi:hypothetical protein|nr:gliding motility lipoprotein GldB [Cyclobacteriaceae bacterium]